MTIWLLLIVVLGPVGCSGSTCSEVYAVTHNGTFAHQARCEGIRDSSQARALPHERWLCVESSRAHLDVIR